MEYAEVVLGSPYAFVATAVVVAVSLLVFLGVQFDREQQRNSTIGIKDEVCFE